MPINFSEVNATLTQTEAEIEEHDTAVAALAEANTALTTAQSAVSTAQDTVTAATATEGGEKADVVAGINTAIQQLTVILQSLQTK